MKLLSTSLILALFVFGGIIFKITAVTVCPQILPDDNIFVLTGDVRRIPFAMRQIKNFPDAHMYIIGVGANKQQITNRNITYENDSKSTYQNALAIKDIVKNNNLNRIVIVTTEDHMHRAKYLIQHELPITEIITCPAPLYGMPPGRRLERWTIEYVKYIVTLLGIKEG